MSFPYHDTCWTRVADFLRNHVKAGEKILAEDMFWWLFPKIYRYANLKYNPEFQYDWVVIHKGALNLFPIKRLVSLLHSMRPVFANEVFMVCTRRTELPEIKYRVKYIRILIRAIKLRLTLSGLAFQDVKGDDVFPDPRSIVQYRSLDSAGLREVMNHFWGNGGYLYQTDRDKMYYNEIDRNIAAMVGASNAKRKVLDLCCGIGRLRAILPNDQIHGVEISDVAIHKARERHIGLENFTFQQMDAHALDFDEGEFDLVLFIDSIEHVHDASRVLAEAARVLRKGGLLMVTVANRDSLNQVMTRKLGYPEFVTNFQHVREFSYQETLSLLANAGFEIIKTSGIFLYPYWGIPGIDQVVRHLTDSDPQIVKLMQILGERVGAEYAYTSVMLAQKIT